MEQLNALTCITPAGTYQTPFGIATVVISPDGRRKVTLHDPATNATHQTAWLPDGTDWKRSMVNGSWTEWVQEA